MKIQRTENNMTMRKAVSSFVFSLLVIAALFFMSCEETVKLDLDEYTSAVVIEGLVTNQENYQFVKVTRTADFYDPGNTPRITNAEVTVTDDLGNVIPFVHNPSGNEDSLGIYIPETPFTGAVGRTYTLHVEVDGLLYEATDKLFPVTTMDSLNYEIDEDEQEDPEVEGRIYSLLLFTQEPQDEINYYLFKFFRNDSLSFDTDSDIYFSDDEFLAENISGVEGPVLYSQGDHARVEMFSISREGYIYYNDLSNLLNNDGGVFSPIPASPRTNLTNGALGFFQVSALDISETEIE